MKETFFSKLQAPMKKCAVPTKRLAHLLHKTTNAFNYSSRVNNAVGVWIFSQYSEILRNIHLERKEYFPGKAPNASTSFLRDFQGGILLPVSALGGPCSPFSVTSRELMHAGQREVRCWMEVFLFFYFLGNLLVCLVLVFTFHILPRQFWVAYTFLKWFCKRIWKKWK